MKILIAEDDLVSRRILEKNLKDFGHNVVVTTNGEEALEKYRTEKITLAVIDWIMPELDGVELCSRIRQFEEKSEKGIEDTEYCYIIMLTVKSEVEDIVEGINAGADDFISKPVDVKELEVRINAGIRIVKLKNQLLEANKKLSDANKMKSEFVSIVSHDLGTPLTVMRGYTKLLLDSTLGEISDKQRKALDAVQINIDHLTALRKDILDVSRIDLGDMVLEKTDVYMGELIDASLANLKPLAVEKGQSIGIDVEKDLVVWADRNKIYQVIINYVSNAIKYTQQGGNITIAARSSADGIHTSVKDDGRGIPKGEEKNVFKRFYRVGKKEKDSTGLGLAIVKEIVEAHAGRVWCESEPDQGSTFHFTIPHKKPQEK